MTIRVLILTALCIAAPVLVSAQNVELVYTPAVLKQTLALKETLRTSVAIVHPFDGLTLAGASAERKKAYKGEVGHVTAIVVVGEDALKSVGDIEFGETLILVNAAGPTAGRGRVIRVFDGSTGLPAGTVAVGTTAAVRDLIAAGREVFLRGRPLEVIVQAVVLALR